MIVVGGMIVQREMWSGSIVGSSIQGRGRWIVILICCHVENLSGCLFGCFADSTCAARLVEERWSRAVSLVFGRSSALA